MEGPNNFDVKLGLFSHKKNYFIRIINIFNIIEFDKRTVC